ncbi:YbaB/EbfC family nucleoid-associated protein [Longispora sp. K20-0274]|uniref:YbaB/EbfC family nucleoid-associated protein n=1 Tax=Longispora sp. K20-0274 TaxID=3088255 RepID=UPI00399A65A8
MDSSRLGKFAGMDLGAMMRQAQEAQVRVQEVQEARAELRVTGASPDGLIEVTVDGTGRAVDIQINARAMRGDSFSIADGVLAAFTKAYQEFDEVNDRMMGEAMGDADIFQKLKSGEMDGYEYLKSFGLDMPEMRGRA